MNRFFVIANKSSPVIPKRADGKIKTVCPFLSKILPDIGRSKIRRITKATKTGEFVLRFRFPYQARQ